MADGSERAGGESLKIPRTNGKHRVCRPCGDWCDVLVLAAVGQATRLWLCPMLSGPEIIDRAVALALMRASLAGGVCVVVRTSDLSP